MAVAINIGKQAPVEQNIEAEVAENTTAFDPRVDELAGLMAWAAKLKKDPRMLRLTELTKQFADEVKEKYDDEPTKDDIVFEGEKTRYKFGARSKTRTVTTEGKVKFANKVGEAAFLECATIALKDIDQYIAKGEQGEYIDEGFGTRTPKMEAKLVEKK